jgi:hypothetical protein
MAPRRSGDRAIRRGRHQTQQRANQGRKPATPAPAIVATEPLATTSGASMLRWGCASEARKTGASAEAKARNCGLLRCAESIELSATNCGKPHPGPRARPKMARYRRDTGNINSMWIGARVMCDNSTSDSRGASGHWAPLLPANPNIATERHRLGASARSPGSIVFPLISKPKRYTNAIDKL